MNAGNLLRSRRAWRVAFVGTGISCAALTLCLGPKFLAAKDYSVTAQTSALAKSGDIHRPLSSLLDRQWLNRPALAAQDLRGKVVLVNFWTYSCINSLRPLPYLRAWADRYGQYGLVVVGVHTPEFGFEHDTGNVRRALADHDVRYPVVMDNDYGIWRQFDNNAWPGFYFVGADGKVRSRRLGEGDYAQSEALIRKLLTEAGADLSAVPLTAPQGEGIEAAPDWADMRTPETYVGYDHAENFASPGGIRRDRSSIYTLPATLALNHWALGGRWTVTNEFAAPEAGSTIDLRFHARDVHLVMGLTPGAKPVRLRITLDGKPVGTNAGTDVDPNGQIQINEDRLYQLMRQTGPIKDRTIRLEFLDPGARTFSFTFG